MKTTLLRLVLAITLVTSSVSCMTAYDAYGRPQTVVDPAGAALGAAAVGLLAYGIASNNNHHHNYYRDDYRRSYYRPSYSYSRYGYGRGHCY